MTYHLSAMDIWFWTSTGTYPFDVRCEMLAELGFDGLSPTLWNDLAWEVVPRLGQIKSAHGLDVTGLFTYLTSPADEVGVRRIERLLRDADGFSRVEIAIFSCGDDLIGASDQRGDELVIPVLQRLLDSADASAVSLSLYPHRSWWLQTTADALRLADRLSHPRMATSFSAYHWYSGDGHDLRQVLRDSAHLLDSVSLSGADGNNRPPTVEPFGQGELDTFTLLAELRHIEYRGPVQFFGYGVGGDVYAQLRGAIEAFKETEQRLERHPDWGADTSLVSPDLPAVLGRSNQWR